MGLILFSIAISYVIASYAAERIHQKPPPKAPPKSAPAGGQKPPAPPPVRSEMSVFGEKQNLWHPEPVIGYSS